MKWNCTSFSQFFIPIELFRYIQTKEEHTLKERGTDSTSAIFHHGIQWMATLDMEANA